MRFAEIMKEKPPVLPAAMRREAEGGGGMKLKLKLGNGGGGGGGGAASPGEDLDANDMDEDDYDDGFDEWSSPEPQPYTTPGTGTEKLVLPLRLGGSSAAVISGGAAAAAAPIPSTSLDPSTVFSAGATDQGGGGAKEEQQQVVVGADPRRQLAVPSPREGSRTPGSGVGTPISEGGGFRAGAAGLQQQQQQQQQSFNVSRGGTPAAVPPLSRPPLAQSASLLLPASSSSAAAAAAAGSPSVLGVGQGLTPGGQAPHQYPRAHPVQTVKPRERVLAKVVAPFTRPRSSLSRFFSLLGPKNCHVLTSTHTVLRSIELRFLPSGRIVSLVNDVVRQHAVVAGKDTERLELGLHYHRPTLPSLPQRTSSRVNGGKSKEPETEETEGQQLLPPPPPPPVKVTTRVSNNNTKVEQPAVPTTTTDGSSSSGNGAGAGGGGVDGGRAGYAINARPGLNVVEIVAGPVEAEEVYRVFVSV
jgi:hypothetical protein